MVKDVLDHQKAEVRVCVSSEQGQAKGSKRSLDIINYCIKWMLLSFQEIELTRKYKLQEQATWEQQNLGTESGLLHKKASVEDASQ